MRGGGAHLANAEEPLDVAPGEERPVELELANGVGDGEEPPASAPSRPARRSACGFGPPQATGN